MTQTNEVKGTISFNYGDKTYTLKADHNALMEVDQLLDCGLIGVINKLGGDGLKIAEIVGIIEAGLRANGDSRLSKAELTQAVFKLGVPSCHKVASEFCTMLFIGVNADTEEDLGK